MSSSNPRPILTLHVGQAGIQIGHAAWELMCLEHNIDNSGAPKQGCGGDHGNVDTMFIASPHGRYFPRSIFVDTDPFCVDEVRTGPYRNLFNSRQLLSDELDSGTNYTTGRYRYTNRLQPETIDRLRWLVEKTDVKPTVCLMHSASGGTGSGFSVACLTHAADELGLNSHNTLDLCVVPGRMAIQSSCELLNTAMYLDESQDLVRQTICVSNSALFRVCTAQLQSNGRATYAHVNRILATAFSNLTATERLAGSSVSLSSILDSLLPFQHLKYPLLACAPFLTAETARIDLPTAKSATAAVLEVGSQFLDVDPRKGRHAAGFLLYRGDTTTGEAHKFAAELTQKKRVQFYDWAPAGFRTGLVGAPPIAPPGSGFADTPISVTMITSHSGVSAIFEEFASAARQLQESDMFVHNYEGAIVALLRRPGLSERGGNGGGTVSDLDDSADMVVVGGGGENSNSMRHLLSPSLMLRTKEGPDLQLRHHQKLHRRPHSSRRIAATASPPQQQQEHIVTPKRTCALSDVFGVRVRLALAIEFLERVARIYARGWQTPPTSSQSSSESGGEDAQWDSAGISRAQADGAKDDGAVQEVEVEEEPDSSVTIVREAEQSADAGEPHRDGGSVSFNDDPVAEVESDSTVRWAEQQFKTEDEATGSPPPQPQKQETLSEEDELKMLEQQMQQQQSQSQYQPTNMNAVEITWSSGESSPTIVETHEVGSGGVASRLRKVAAQFGSLWRKLGGGQSLRQQQQQHQQQQQQQQQQHQHHQQQRRRQKQLQQMRQQMQQLVSLSSQAGLAGSTSEQEKYPVIAEAERILMKYRFRNTD